MNRPVFWRQACALGVAYVLALQALLLPLSAVAGASVSNSICSAATTNDVQDPGSRDAKDACAIGCGICCPSHSLNGVPAVIALELPGAACQQALPIAAPTTAPSKGPQIARAPPA